MSSKLCAERRPHLAHRYAAGITNGMQLAYDCPGVPAATSTAMPPCTCPLPEVRRIPDTTRLEIVHPADPDCLVHGHVYR